MSAFASTVTKNYFPDPNQNLMDSLFAQYERVIVESIITSFGLDLLITDQHGGDVDTILNVRKVGQDPDMTYKNAKNQAAYESRGEYNSTEYHHHSGYIHKNREVHQQKESGTLFDAYTGKKIGTNEKSDLDHTISAKAIHDDAGRVLAGLNGADLANSPENLNATNPHTNRSKKAMSMDEYLEKYGTEYTEEEKNKMRQADKIARASYERKLAYTYYTSPKFWGDTAKAAGKKAALMGVRQAWGLVFTEMWFAVKQEFTKLPQPFDFVNLLTSIGNGIKTGFNNAKSKYKELIEKFISGASAGALSSLTETLCNIFFTTAKNTGRIIRQSYASLVQATEVLFLNPDNYLFGERMRATAKILATGASVVVGVVVNEAIEKTAIGALPVVGEIIPTFCGSLVTGIMTCSLLYFLDRSPIIGRLVSVLDSIPSMSSDINYYTKQAQLFEQYAAELMEIDIKKFTSEAHTYHRLLNTLDSCKNETELNMVLRHAIEEIGIKIPWRGTFNNFMSNKNNRLVFG